MTRYFYLLLLLLCGTATYAQRTYLSSNYADIGDSFLVSQVSILNLGNEDFRPTGANYVWDYSGLNPYAQRYASFVSPNSTGFLPGFTAICTFNCFNSCYANCMANNGIQVICTGLCTGTCGADCLANWNSSFNIAELTNDSINLGVTSITQVYNLYKKDNSGLYRNAIGARIANVPLVAQFDAPDRVYRFPMRYGDSVTTVSTYSVKLDSIPGTGINFSFSYKHAQTRTNYVDGWGTITTPYATYDSVLKHRSVIHNRDSVTVLGNTITLDNFLPDEFIPDTVIEYSWFSKGEGVPVLKVTAWLINGDEIYQSAEYRDSIRCFEPFAVFGYLPIPATLNNGDDSVEVNFYNLSFNANTFNWDFDDPYTTNNTAQGQNPSHWYTEGGLYTVTLTICNTGCAQGWCEDVSLPVLVVDNRTVGLGKLGNAGGLNVFPNPFTSGITLQLPNLTPTAFLLYDLAGKQMPLPNPTVANSQYSWEQLDYLPDGAYLLAIKAGEAWYNIRLVKLDH